VEVQFVAGRHAVLTIFEDGKEREQVTLSNIKTKTEMHTLMIQKGFERMSKEEIEAMKVEVVKRQEEEKKELEDARELRGGVGRLSQERIEALKVQVEKGLKEEKKKLEDAQELRDNRKPVERKVGEVPKQSSSRKAVEVQEQMLVGTRRKEVEAKMLLDGAPEKVRTKPAGFRLLLPLFMGAIVAGFILVKKRQAKKVIHAT
jgi:hypothetical protein